MDWKSRIENIGPDSLLEIPDVGVYDSNRTYFKEWGFNELRFAKIFPIIEQQIWSVFQLFKYASKTPIGATLLEIGSGRGGSISTMGLANLNANLVNIDKFMPFDEESAFGMSKGYQGFTYPDFLRNIEPIDIKSRLTTILKWSDEAVGDVKDASCDLIFIDGNHSYENCKRDIENYIPKLKVGGILCGHDYHPRFPGVIKAVKEIFGDSFVVADNSSMWVVE
jgi:hypothetical protein